MTAGTLTEPELVLDIGLEPDTAEPDPADVDCTEHPGCQPIG